MVSCLGIALGLVGSDVSGVTPAVSTVHTDGWYGYLPLHTAAYQHRISNQKGHPERASELLPRVHQIFSLLKRWLLGPHQGSVGEHLQDYLNEFAFRFNRRKSRSRGKLFFRLVQQAVAIEPTTYRKIVASAIKRK
jgi:transposase-like protein